eukprot:9160_1
MSTGNGVEDLCITLEANLLKNQMEFKTNLYRTYNRRLINLEQNMKLIENRYNEYVEKMLKDISNLRSKNLSHFINGTYMVKTENIEAEESLLSSMPTISDIPPISDSPLITHPIRDIHIKTEIDIGDNKHIHIKTEPHISHIKTKSHNEKYKIKSHPSLPRKHYKKDKKKLKFKIINTKRKSTSKYALGLHKKRKNKNKKSLFYEKKSNKNKNKNKKIIHINKYTSHLECPLSGKEIEQIKNKINQMFQRDTNVEIQCPWCDYIGGKWAYKYHLTSHTDELNYQCDLCGKKMKRQASVNLHKKRNRGGDSNCPVIKARNEKILNNKEY